MMIGGITMRGNPMRHMRRPGFSTYQPTRLESFFVHCAFPALLLGGACAAWQYYRAFHFPAANTAHSRQARDFGALFSGAAGSEMPIHAIKAVCESPFKPK